MTTKRKSATSRPQDDPDPRLGILGKSKVISKLEKNLPDKPVKPKKTNKKQATDNDNTKTTQGYDTFTPTQKVEILELLKKKLISLEGLQEADLEDLSNLHWNDHLKELGYQMFNQFLGEIIPEYKPFWNYDRDRLTKLRKQVSGWLEKELDDETRGKPLILEKDMPKFLKTLTRIILSLPTRSITELRERVIPEIIRINEGDREFEGNIFSPHYWCQFKTDHPEIKELWETRPRTAKSSTDISTEASTFEPQSPSDNYEEMEICESELSSPVREFYVLFEAFKRRGEIIENRMECTERSDRLYFQSK